MAATAADPAARAIAEALRRDGLAEVDDWGLDIAALNASIDAAFARPDPKVTSVACQPQP